MSEAGGVEAEIVNASGAGPVLLVCEHASNFIPPEYRFLGLDPRALSLHSAWDIGARALAGRLSAALDAPLVAARFSRLLIDANRAPDAPDLIVTHAEDTPVPGNVVTPAERAKRIQQFHEPFHAAIETLLARRAGFSAVVSVHSFTPFLFGQQRPWHAGLLHGADSRIADAMIAALSRDSTLTIGRNQPYAPADGVFYTMARHARGRASAMIEVRNDLLEDEAGVARWADRLAHALTTALNAFGPHEFHVQRKTSNRS